MVKKKGGKQKEDLSTVDEDIKILSTGFFIFLVVSFFAFFVNFRITGGVTAIDIFQLGGGVANLETQLIIAKYIMFLTITFILYWAFDLLIEKFSFGKFIISAGMAWLSLAFLIKEDILTALTSFSALGILFMVGLPFLGILLISSRLLNLKKINAPKLLTQKVIWGAYSVFLLYFLFTTTNMFGFVVGDDPTKGSGGLAWVILGVFLVSAFFFIFNSKFVQMMINLQKQVTKLEGEKSILESEAFRYKAARKNQSKILDAMSDKINQVADKISSAEYASPEHNKWASDLVRTISDLSR